VHNFFQLGDKVALISSTKLDVIATGVVIGICGQQGVHHCTQVDIGWYQMHLTCKNNGGFWQYSSTHNK
jgi:hypothetical protein